MARNYFSYTVIKANPALNNLGSDAVLTSLAGINWTSFKLDAAGVVIDQQGSTVYAARSGGSGAATGGTTSYNGVIEFWADAGEYKITIVDPSARIGSKDIFWSSVSGQDGGIPGTKISNDDALVSNQIQDGTISTADIGALQVTNAKLAADSVTTAKIADLQVTGAKIADNVLPLGSVIDWYRVTSGTFVPAGWAVCDGSLWNDIDNDMGASKAKLTTGNIPNLVGKFTVGARLTTTASGATPADGTGSTNGNAYANAPGIGGAGGSNAAIDLAHTHTVPAHSHSDFTGFAVTGGNHGHGNNLSGASHSHTYERSNDYNVGLAAGGTTPNWQIARSSQNTGPSSNNGISGGVYDSASHSHGFTGSIGNAAVAGDSAMTSGSPSWAAAVTDVRPAHIGLLKIMKVKSV